MEGFFGMVLNMGLIDMPEIQDYWSTAWSCQVPFFSNVMPRRRFMNTFWLLHVSCERDGMPPRRIDKVKSFVDPLLGQFQSHYCPSRKVSGDETMVGHRGRFGALQYIPNKPEKYGIKAFTLADSANRYMLNILVYTGADTLDEADPNYRTLPQPGRVVLHLLQPYLDKGYHVYTDRYYTSIPLANALEERSTSFTGTAVRNRANLPDDIRRPSRLADNEVKAYRADRFLALEWKAPAKKKSLVMISTQSSAQINDHSTQEVEPGDSGEGCGSQ